MKKCYTAFLLLVFLFCTSCEHESPIKSIMMSEAMSYQPYKVGDIHQFKSSSGHTISLKVESVNTELKFQTAYGYFYCAHDVQLVGFDDKTSVRLVVNIKCPHESDTKYNIMVQSVGNIYYNYVMLPFNGINDYEDEYSKIGNIQSSIEFHEINSSRKLGIYERNVGLSVIYCNGETFNLVK